MIKKRVCEQVDERPLFAPRQRAKDLQDRGSPGSDVGQQQPPGQAPAPASPTGNNL